MIFNFLNFQCNLRNACNNHKLKSMFYLVRFQVYSEKEYYTLDKIIHIKQIINVR